MSVRPPAVHTVGNVGRCRGSLRWPLLAAYATVPLYVLWSLQVVHYTALASVLAFEYGAKEWRRTPPPPRSACRSGVTARGRGGGWGRTE